MNYLSQKISKIFKVDLFTSMLKLDYDIKSVVSILSVIAICYMVLTPVYNLIKKLFSNKNNENNKNCDDSETLTYRKYRTITSSKCKGCNSSSSDSDKLCKTNKSYSICKNNVDRVLRNYKITQ